MGFIEYTTGIQPDVFDKDDAYSKLQGTRDGAAFSADWVLARCLEGRVFAGNLGSATGPATLSAGSADTTEFDYFMSVPSGTTVIPLEIVIYMETWGTNGIAEVLGVVGASGVTGAGTSVTPVNLRRDAPFASLCTVTGAATATSATAITGVEFLRDGHQTAQTPATALATGSKLQNKFVWSHKSAGYAPVIVGAGQLGLVCSTVSGTGFITVVWAELPSTRIV